MFNLTDVKAYSLQDVLNKAAKNLQSASRNFCYKSNHDICIFQLLPKSEAFDLGLSREAYSLGPVKKYSPILCSFLTGESSSKTRVETKGVNTTQSQVKLSKISHQHNFWYSHLCSQIEKLLGGDDTAVNAIAHPIARHTLRSNAYKPCPTYVQYQMRQKDGSLHVAINYRAQHLYMLAVNVQQWAFQLLQLCCKFRLRLGSVLLNCTNHHVFEGQDPKAVCGTPIPWVVEPDSTPHLVRSIQKYYQQF